MTNDAVGRRKASGLGIFERYLTLWVALCIVAGIALGAVAPGPFRILGDLNIAKVNMPVAALIWLMIVPFRRTRAAAAAAFGPVAGRCPRSPPRTAPRAFAAASAAPLLLGHYGVDPHHQVIGTGHVGGPDGDAILQ